MTAILPLQNPPRIRGGFATVAQPLIGRDGEPLSESEWNKGVEWTNFGAGETFVSGMGGGSWGLIADGDEKPVNPNPDSELFLPLMLGAMFSCEMNAPGGVLGDVSRERAQNLLDRRTYSDLARILSTGEAYTCADPDGSDPNPSLQSEAVFPDGFDGVTPGSIRGVLQGLLDGTCGAPGGGPGWNSDPVFHVPRAWMPHFLGDIVRWHEEDGTFRFGPYRVAFDCYPNVAPTAGGGTTNPDGSEVWIYATLPPQIAYGEQMETSLVRAELRNTYTARAERTAIVAFDTTLVLAAKALVG